MLQPRKRKYFSRSIPNSLLLSFVLSILALNADVIKGEVDEDSSINRKIRSGERLIKHGDVNILILDDVDRKKYPQPTGLLSTTARTFIQEGTTTEYATHIYGTTVGNKYAHIVSTGSRIFYDNMRPQKDFNNAIDPIVTLPILDSLDIQTEDNLIIPNSTPSASFERPNNPDIFNKELLESEKHLDDIASKNINEDNVTSNQKEIDDEITTESNEYTTFNYVRTSSSNRTSFLRGRINYMDTKNKSNQDSKISVKKEISIKPGRVIPKNQLPTFTIKQDGDSEIEENEFTTWKPEKMEKSVRGGKNLIENRISQTLKTTTYFGFADFTTTVADTVIIFSPKTSHQPIGGTVTSIIGEATLSSSVQKAKESYQTSILPSNVFETTRSSSTKYSEEPRKDIESSVSIDGDVSINLSTEPLPKIYNLHSRIFKSGTNPVGLVKTVSGIETLNGTSTQFTTFFYGTYTNNRYTQLEQVSSKILTDNVKERFKIEPTIIKTTNYPIKYEADETTTEQERTTENDVTTEPATENEINVPTSDNDDDSESTIATDVLPSTVYKTYTYLTTFFLTLDDGQTTTSIDSNVVSIPETLQANSVTKDFISVENTAVGTTPIENVAHVGTTPIENTANYGTTPIENAVHVGTTTETDDDTTLSDVTTEEEEEEEELESSEKYEDNGDEETTTNEITTENTIITTPLNKETNLSNISNINEDDHKVSIETTTPEYRDNVENDITTPKDVAEKSNDNFLAIPLSTNDSKSLTEEKEEEVELIFKTIYTTYTYLTTFFEKSSSRVTSREEVVTNVVTSTLDNDFIRLATDPAVAGLFANYEDNLISSAANENRKGKLLRNGLGHPTSKYDDILASTVDLNDVNNDLRDPTPTLNRIPQLTESSIQMHFTTYTYFSTVIKDGKTSVLNRTDVYTNSIHPTNVAKNEITRMPLYEGDSSLIGDEKIPPFEDKNLQKSTKLKNTPGFLYKTTIKRLRPSNSTKLSVRATNFPDIIDNRIDGNQANNLSENTTANPVIDKYTTVAGIRRSTSDESKRVFLDGDVGIDDQISLESNHEDIDPSVSFIALQTSYTTYTYFTTVYKGSTSSDLISRLETVTNVVSELVKPTEINPTVPSHTPEESTLPITYFTTFTYWTTYYKDNSTVIQSRQEIVSDIVSATDVNLETQAKTDTVSSEDKVDDLIIPTKNSNFLSDQLTYYTTFTYFTTSYIGNVSVLNSHLETVTNIIDLSKQTPVSESMKTELKGPAFNPTGLLSTTENTAVNDKITTVFTTNTYGTYINGFYTQILDSTSQILPNISNNDSVTQTIEQPLPTGVVSVNEGMNVDGYGISTTFYTTKVIGTYLDKLYAQIIESTSSTKVDENRKTDSLFRSSTVVVGDKTYQTGLLHLVQGSEIKDRTTTFYESQIRGSIINEKYTVLTETSTSIYIQPTISSASKSATIQSTPVLDIKSNIQPTLSTLSTSPTPAVIESSLDEGFTTTEKGEDNDDTSAVQQVRRKSFTPVIRPFASRSRPAFLPKKKTGENSSATTITRGITPTIVATPALKSNEKYNTGTTSKNRFAGNRKSSSNYNSPISTSPISSSCYGSNCNSNSNRFSRTKSSASAHSSSIYQSVNGKDRTNKSTSTASFANLRRGSYRPSIGKPLEIPSSIYVSSSRSRIRPTLSSAGRYQSTTRTTSSADEDDNDFGSTANTEQSLPTGDEDDTLETFSPITTTPKYNPLLRLRKPTSRGTTTTTTTTTKASTSQRRNLTGRKNGNENRITTSKNPISTTKSPRTRTPSTLNNRLHPRPSSSLFPRKNLIKKQQEVENEDTNLQEDELGDQDQISIDDSVEITENSESEYNTITEDSTFRRGRNYNGGEIKPFPKKGRSKRQAEFGYKYEIAGKTYNSRYRRPVQMQYTFPDYLYYDDVELATEDIFLRSISSSRNPYAKSRNQQHPAYHQQLQQQSYTQNTKIHASTTSSRPQFTIREKATNPSTTPRSTSRRVTTQANPTSRRYNHNTELTTKRSKQSKQFRLRSHATTTEPSTYRNNRKYSSSRKPPSRSRYRDNDLTSNTYSPGFEGVITVTHKIPTELTIPIINGKVTEYKNVITAKPSIQILGPNQYSTVLGKNGIPIVQLVSEVTEALPNGAMQVTKFVIHEMQTTSVTFTPTVIRGRKTSFSHVIPSTVYEIKPEVSTIQPQLAANAPLANILLSQLLLGNLGLQPSINPLLAAANNQMLLQTPVTEYKTKTTTYVTTITDATSTIIPVTFRGKEIKTTVIDSSTQVITATEYITETIVITPTHAVSPGNSNQLNTLLLPALLQAQLLNQPQNLAQMNNIVPQTTIVSEEDMANYELTQDASSKVTRSKHKLDLQNDNINQNSDEYTDYAQKDENKQKKKNKTDKKTFDSPIKPAETSIVTLYVSGRRPGEFSTVLSTVTLEETPATLRKREVDYQDVYSSTLPDITSSISTTDAEAPYDIKSGMNELLLENSSTETQSLESIIGDVGNYLKSEELGPKNTQIVGSGDSKNVQNHFLLKTSTENTPFQWNMNNEIGEFEDSSQTRRKRSLNLKVNSTDNTSKTKIISEILGNKSLIKSEIFRDRFKFDGTRNKSTTNITGSTGKFLTPQADYEFKRRASFDNRKGNSLENSFLFKNESERNMAPTTWKPQVRNARNNLKNNSKQNVQIEFRDTSFRNVNMFPEESIFTSNNKSAKFNKTSRSYSSNAAEEEARGRYNLATKIMSNGVEVIVALDKSTLPGVPQVLRILPTSKIRPITLAPSTVTDHMKMMLPHGLQDVPNPFITRTYLTTYTYMTTFLKEGATAVSSNEKIVSNTLTKRPDPLEAGLPTDSVADMAAHVTLTSSPTLTTSVFETTFTIENTVTDADIPYVQTSKQTVSNTLTAPADYMQFLQSSEPSFSEMNSAELFTRTPINEDYTVPPTEKLNTRPIEITSTSLQAADITKTYFVTYTYYSTLLENGSTVVKSNVATSSDVITEKMYLPQKRTKTPYNEVQETKPLVSTSDEKSINIFATKTYLTTFTYFTTLLQDKGNKSRQTVVRSRTKVVQNIVTESLNTDLLNSEYLSTLRSSLNHDSLPIVATATLNNGQKLEITAMNENSNQILNYDSISSSLEDSEIHENNLVSNNKYPQSMKYDSNKDKNSIQHNFNNHKIIFRNESTEEEGNSMNPSGEQVSHTFLTTILQSTAVIKNGATLMPGSQIIKYTDNNGNVTIIPVSDPVSKHPDGSNSNTKPGNNQFNDLLSLGSLGINSFTALKPVINAMAGLLQNNIKTNVKDKTDSKIPNKLYFNKNPPLNTNLKPPNRTPIYIPVGTLSQDSDAAESQDENLLEQFPDTNQRNNLVLSGKPTMESPLVSGGISISPGQIINANTDVIVGTPSVLGPRPPIKQPHEKNDIPVGMKPPPIIQSFPALLPEEEAAIHKFPLKDATRLPPKSHPQGYLNPSFHITATNNNKYNPRITRPNFMNSNDLKVPLSSEIHTHHVTLHGSIPVNSETQHDRIKSSEIIPPIKINHPLLLEEHSLNPLLVNVQPSQVAQVIIPHGSQTTLIYSDRTTSHGTKGEIFNDPSPYPEPNVNPGFVGLRVYGPANVGNGEEISKLSSTLNTIHLDIPIDPYNDGAITESHHVIVLNDNLNIPDSNVYKNWSLFNGGNSFVKIPPNNILNVANKRPNSKYNFTTQNILDSVDLSNPPVTHQNNALSNSNINQNVRPFIFPQKNNYNWSNFNNNLLSPTSSHPLSTLQTPANEVHYEPDSDLEYEDENDEHDSNRDSSMLTSDELKEQSEQYPNHFSNEYRPTQSSTIASNDHFTEDLNHYVSNKPHLDYQWEVMKIRPQSSNSERPLNVKRKPAVDGYGKITFDKAPLEYNTNNLKPQSDIVKYDKGNNKTPAASHSSSNLADKNNQFGISSDINTVLSFEKVTNSGSDKKPDVMDFLQEGSTTPKTHAKKPVSHINLNNETNISDNRVIGLSPPPLSQFSPSDANQQSSYEKPSYINKNNNGNNNNNNNNNRENSRHKPSPQRAPARNKPKPNPPYPFERPVPSVQSVPIFKPIKSVRPVTNLHEGDAKHGEEILKLKPLNTTGKIEPVRRWQGSSSTLKSNHILPTVGSHMIVGEPVKRPEFTTVHTRLTANIYSESGDSREQHGQYQKQPSQQQNREQVVKEQNITNKDKNINREQNSANKEQAKEQPHKKQNIDSTEVNEGQNLANKISNIANLEQTNTNQNQTTRDREQMRDHESDSTSSQNEMKVIAVKPVTDNIVEKTTELISKWNENGIISSSKPDFEDIEFNEDTPSLNSTKTAVYAGTSQNTIFGNLYTRPPPANIVIIPTPTTTNHHTVISMVIDNEHQTFNEQPDNIQHDNGQDSIRSNGAKPDPTPSIVLPEIYQIKENVKNEDGKMNSNQLDMESHKISYPTYYLTHTQTLSVTVTETTVLQRDGQTSTHTVVLTKTQTSTLVDTITEVHTLVQPTKILSTITTTIPIPLVTEEFSYPMSELPVTVHTTSSSHFDPDESDSILVVMSDKRPGTVQIIPTSPDAKPTAPEIQLPDETNEISPNDILYSGIFTQHSSDNECRPECKAVKNEICQKVDKTMRCVCRPGFARMFPDHPCKPTYTYVMRMVLDRKGQDAIKYTDNLADRSSPIHHHLSEAAREGLDRMVMQSDLRDVYHGIVVSGFEPAKKSDKASVVYIVQLSENTEELKLRDEIHKSLRANNFSLGGTDVYAAPDMLHFIRAEDFDECSDDKFHDCSDNAECLNLRGTYTCSCKDGFTDLSHNVQFPGRTCTADIIGCEYCNYHGTCYFKENEQAFCECFQWYTGDRCQINLKVTLISLVVAGVFLSILLVACVVMTCNKEKQPPEILRSAPKPHVGFRRYRSVTNLSGDKRAIVSIDTSSEGSLERTPPPYLKQRPMHVERHIQRRSAGTIHSESSQGGCTIQSMEQRDRSLTVLIPRAKFRPSQVTAPSSLLNMSTFGPEQKLISYSNSNGTRTPEKRISHCNIHSNRKQSTSTVQSTDITPRKKLSAPRRPSSGALVSAGFEVSATVRRTQELDESYSQPHTDLSQHAFSTMRTAERTVSEVRSYDETTIHPPVRSFHHNMHHMLTCDHSSSQKTANDEHHTMGERDLGSTYLMPKSQLYKHDHRESDGSNFDSI